MPKPILAVPAPRDVNRQHDAHFVGRANELALFQEVLSGVVRGHGCVLLIAAKSGLGKTRLLEHFHSMATAAQVAVVSATCRRSGAAARDFPTVDALVERVTAAAAHRSSVVLLDDLHLAGEPELAAVEAVVDACFTHRLALVACYSEWAGVPASLAQVAGTWERDGARMHRLVPLSEAEIALLIRHRSLSTSAALTPSVSDEIARVSSGNPRYLHELFDELLAGVPTSLLIPRSAQASATSLRARMSREQIAVLELAAVGGERFCDRWLRRVLSSSDDAIAMTLQMAVDSGVLSELGDPAGFYAFRDRAIRKALYVGIVGYRRRLLHARIARMLVAVRADATLDELIAEHWHASGKSARAAEWLARAATQAANARRYRDAANLCERGVSHIVRGSQEWLALQERAAHYYEQAGLIVNALPIRETMLSLLDPSQDVDRFASACYALMYDYGFMGWPEKAIGVARSLRAVKSATVRQIVSWAMVSLALGLLHDGIESKSRAALAVARKVDRSAVERPKYVLAAAMLRSASTPVEETLATLRSAVDLSQRSAGAYGVPWMLAEAATFACQLGELAAALRYAEDAEKAALAARESSEREAAESGELSRWITIHRSEVLLAAGNVAAARDLMFALAEMRNGGEIWDATVAALNVFVGLRAGDRALIGAYFDIGLLRRAVDRRQVDLCGLLLMGFGEVMASRGLTDELTKMLRTCAEQRFVDSRFAIPLAIARYGPMDCVDRARSELSRRSRRADGRVAAAANQLFDAFVAKRRNNASAAIEAASQAAAAFGALGWRLHEALAFELAGDYNAARDAYQKLGASQDAARLSDPQGRKKVRAYFGAELTPREEQVAEFVCAGLTNAAIARHLSISHRTVHHHVEALFSKLGIRARWQLTRMLLRASKPG